ncbi:S-adenosyl-l-methionine hydroxide adenosyltransferase [Thermoanaerobacter uzonensis DSM 18761]|uniref:S-adenosyl-l-methionine hydroxide adenosyltransferase n=2 Tax=Thermoanaerobacter uzonensis TaxID=447593 RepID=A0A1M4X8N2_9THEO|nr:S-adenosyl-l-methionine hydroxide adenosyltransferase [Thermoanaerobacter uzonensis DSM 18761]
MERIKKIVSLLLIVAIVFFQLPMIAQAENSISNTVVATVVDIQKYGNLVMDVKPKALYDAGFELGDILKVTVNDNIIEMPFCTSYSDVDVGNPLVRDDQTNNLLIIAINMGNFAAKYNVKVGDKVSFSLAEKGGYLAQYQIHKLTRTNVRSDYATDSIFANFRSITTTGIKPGILYRSSSPIDNEIGRAAYAERLVEAVGINTVINTSDSDEEIKNYLSLDGDSASYYKSLYDNGKVIALNMGVDFSAKDFEQKLAEGLRFMINNDGPYLIHCVEGKDRTGFVSAVLEALMGATLDEIIADYMISYENYYGVKENSEQYKTIANSTIVPELTTIVCGLPKGSDISKVDLATASENYLKKIGLTSDEIAAIKAKLSGNPIYKTPNVSGVVMKIDKYGHPVTNITIDDFNKLGFKFGDMVTVVFDNGFVLEAPYLDGYFVSIGDPVVIAYPGDTYITIALNYVRLDTIAHVKAGDKFTIMLSQPKGYLAQYEANKLTRTNNRADYSSDEVFANFRNIAVGNIAKGILYRSSSPINNVLGRAPYACKLMKEANINTVINLSDSPQEINTYLAKNLCPYYADLYKEGHVIALNMGLDVTSDDFKVKLVKGLEFMAENKGPYLIHCTEGKDRTGIVAALLEALMGASKDEIVDDYMQSFTDYYGVQKGTEKYNLIAQQNILKILKIIAKADNLDKVDLAASAYNYLISAGMTPEQINMLKVNLSTPVQEKTKVPSTSQPEPQKTSATTYNYGIVTASTLNVREGAGLGYKVIGVLPAGKVVTLLEEVNGWYKIDYNGKTGYIYSKYVAATPNPSNVVVLKAVKVTAKSGLNVRVSNSINARKIGAVPYGTKLKVVGEYNGWYQVLYNGGFGYVYGKYTK